ncbi:MAG: sulfur oxidation c-type cytochrome SoxA [Betaproteobacteria bacterium]|nr:sulfur oxidation c-type cytochrome SoxA [Betaproteobacteria bacterium]MDH3436128.1 sulfur oxidation c-type cytochrome SoxA [Betaproteobacteria bacterium]
MRHALTLWIFVVLAAGFPISQAVAQTDPRTAEEFDRFRAIMEEANPAELFEVKGEELWKKKRGPKNASLEQCDLGLGPGVVKGAYVQLPRYFADTGKVMDAEQRVVHCMITLQGFSYAALAKRPFSRGSYTPDPVAIVTYIAAQSKGMKIAVRQSHPKELENYEVGREIFFYRAGPWDFSCASCHGQDNLRIRTQPLPNFTQPEQAARSFMGWPGYRMTGGVMHTLQWRLTDCFRQQRFPYLSYVSDTHTALLTYLGVNANGHEYRGPGIKR